MKADYYFSPQTNLFYPVVLEALYRENRSLPDELTPVDEATYRAFLPENQPVGKQVGSDEAGHPNWIDEKPMTDKELQVWTELTKQRLSQEAEAIIKPLERAVGLGMATDDEKIRLKDWEKYTVMLNRVDPAAPVWPEVPA